MNKVFRYGSIIAAAGIVSAAAACSSGGSSDGTPPAPSYTDPNQGADQEICLLVTNDQAFGAATAAQAQSLLPQMSVNMQQYIQGALQIFQDNQPAAIEAYRQQVVPMPGTDPQTYTEEKVAARIEQNKQALTNQVNTILQYCKYK